VRRMAVDHATSVTGQRTPAGRVGPPGLVVVGWREWVTIPDFSDVAIKAKIDTGARSSALHAFGLRLFHGAGERPRVRFTIHPLQRRAQPSIDVEADVVDEREVRSSNGAVELRPVIRPIIQLAGRRLPIELTLTRRDEMGFRMLLGREALRRRFLVDSGASYLGGRPLAAPAQKRTRRAVHPTEPEKGTIR